MSLQIVSESLINGHKVVSRLDRDLYTSIKGEKLLQAIETSETLKNDMFGETVVGDISFYELAK
jgi:hypothetical protein